MTCMIFCWLIMPRNLWVTLENCWKTILHFKVVLAAIFMKININNRKIRPYSQFYSLITSKCVPSNSEIIQILLSHSPWYGDVQVTFSRFYWNSKWPPQINFNFLGGVKTQKNCLVNFFLDFNITFLATWGCASDFFKDATKFKNGRQMSTPKFFVGPKTAKLKERSYSNFTITFSMIWRFASDFFKVLLKFKIAAMDKLHIFLWAQKLKNWNQ